MYDDSVAMNVPMVDREDFSHSSIEELGHIFMSITDQIEKLMAERERVRKTFNDKHGSIHAKVHERDSQFQSRVGIGYQDQPMAEPEMRRF